MRGSRSKRIRRRPFSVRRRLSLATKPACGSRGPILIPPINQSARLAAGRCSCYVRPVGCEEHYMRLMMQGLTDAAFEQRFGAEGACLAALAAARQAAGMACPRCGNPKSYVYGRRVGCTRCNQRWSVTSGTVMADTKLPLTHWFRAMHLMTSTKQGISAIELGRRLGVSYPTAWYLHKRLRHAMTERGARHVLGAAPADGCARPTVEADDVYLGGEHNQGRGTAGKTRVIAACERQADGAMGYDEGRRELHRRACRGVPRCPHRPWRPHPHGRPARLSRLRRSRNPTHPPGHSHRQQAPRPGARIGVLLDQYRDRQPQHRDQGHLQSALAEAPARLSRRLLLDHEPPQKHARHDQRRLPRHRYINRADQKDRLCTACRRDWLIGGFAYGLTIRPGSWPSKCWIAAAAGCFKRFRPPSSPISWAGPAITASLAAWSAQFRGSAVRRARSSPDISSRR